MRKILICVSLIALANTLTGCGAGSAADQPAAPTPVSIAPSEAYAQVASNTNVVNVQLGTACQVGSAAYQNEICMTVTVCAPSTSTCTSIPNILLDTGSYGLRIFSSKIPGALNSALTAVTSGGNQVYNCATYLDNSGDWGAVKKADIQMGGLTASNVPIEIIDPLTGTPSGNCSQAIMSPAVLDSDPAAAGFNGIIGVGLFAQDCGASCTSAGSGVYFSCPGSGACTDVGVTLADQVTNPVTKLTTYNNGVVLNIPNVGGNGQGSLSGQMILGINVGAFSNNTPSTAKVMQTDATGYFRTTYGGTLYTKAFVDSGSNGLYFAGTITRCSDGTFYCPAGAVNSSATMSGAAATATASVTQALQFQINNTTTLLSANGGGNRVFNNFGGHQSGGLFDWGLPIFLGRKVYVGYSGASVGGVSGPFWGL